MATSPELQKLRVESLTERQREVLRLTSLGCELREIAAILGISAFTVNNHRCEAMKKLGTDKATLAARLTIKFKISSMDDRLTHAEQRKSGRKDDGWN